MKQIVIYTQPDCPPCEVTKMFLNDKGIPFIEKNIKTDPGARNELIKKYKSFSTPTVIIGNKVITGFNPGKIEKELSEQS